MYLKMQLVREIEPVVDFRCVEEESALLDIYNILIILVDVDCNQQ